MNNVFFDYLRKHFPNNSEELFTKFNVYAALLEEQSKIHNLTAIAPEEYYEKHFLDSLLLSETYDFRDESLIDIGTGAGFPGLVLAIVFPTLKVTLLEPTKKRCDFLNMVIKSLNLENTTVINERAEDYVIKARESFDLAATRAVAHMSIVLELSTPLIKNGGSVLVMKGKNYEQELEEASNAIYVLKLEVGKTLQQFLPSDGSMRVNARLIKKGITPQKYPRAFAKIKKNPL